MRSAIARLSVLTSNQCNSRSCFFCTILLKHNWCLCLCLRAFSLSREHLCQGGCRHDRHLPEPHCSARGFCRPAGERCQEFHAYFSIYLAAAPDAGLTAPSIDTILFCNTTFLATQPWSGLLNGPLDPLTMHIFGPTIFNGEHLVLGWFFFSLYLHHSGIRDAPSWSAEISALQWIVTLLLLCGPNAWVNIYIYIYWFNNTFTGKWLFFIMFFSILRAAVRHNVHTRITFTAVLSTHRGPNPGRVISEHQCVKSCGLVWVSG